jgi:6-pyruvoyltetrahydropterin/6-carboxytetrahydropterin synthase
MFKLTKKFRFEASHRLPHQGGKCARLHGHSWVGEVAVEGSGLATSGPRAGMLLDYGEMKAALQPLVDAKLDHWHLNETTGLENPTSEELARWIFDQLAPALPCLASVAIEETCTSRCEYRP